ncbi:Sigma 54 modulation protein/ribosomal protein S30EA [gamma proteobacterium HdN1]|nr:Sigma 54 modulation protein/ribosomal protein S30EA [gamma proteobacterium HdN1]
MQIAISGHHVELTDSLKDYTSEKLSKLYRQVDDILSIQVVLTVEKSVQKAEATVRMKGADYFANAESEDMYTAIDLLSDKLSRQVVKHKEKLTARHQGMGR